MQKTKITEIREIYTQKKRIRTAAGEYEFKEVTLTRFKEVNYIEGWARFGGFLLDIIFILIFEALFGMALAVVLMLIGYEDLFYDKGFDVFLRLLTWLFIRPLFYIIFEGAMQGTPAKLILGRRVVNEYGEKPSFGQIVARSYGRMVPFEAFSCLSTLGWHDTWSKTFVVSKDELKALKLAIQVQDFDKPDAMETKPAGEFKPTDL